MIGMILAVLLHAAPQIDIVAPADPAITVNRPAGPAYTPYMVVLTNKTDRNIVGLAVTWTPEGGQPYGAQSESFASTTKTPDDPWTISPRPGATRFNLRQQSAVGGVHRDGSRSWFWF